MNALLKWNANTESDMASYNLYRSVDGTPPSFHLNIPFPATSVTDPLPDGTYTVVYELTAVDKGGKESAHSASVSAAVDTNPPQAPTGLTLVLA